MHCLECCKKKNNTRKENKTPIFLLYCFECKLYFKDEKCYNNHLKKVHKEKI